MMAAAAVALIGGAFLIGWYVWDLFAYGTVRWIPLALSALTTLAFWIVVAVRTFREYRYYSLVSHARERLEGRLSEATSTNSESVELSPDDLAVLSRAEQHEVGRTVEAAVEQLPEVLDSSWGVAIAPSARQYLDHLADEEPNAWKRLVEAIQDLQHDPQPAGAKTVQGSSHGGMELATEACAVDYEVDAELRQVYVTSIEDEPKGAPHD